MADRSPRDTGMRASNTRPVTWQPPNLLPDPNPKEGVVYRWIRTATLGQSDSPNISTRFREGWEPVPAADVPEVQMVSDKNSRFPDNVEVGGLLLCRNSVENTQARKAYYENVAKNQIAAADQALMRENDPRMPLSTPQRSSTVTFGSQKSR